jgi:hypothetical protein
VLTKLNRIIRLNPDVLIRDDRWLIEQLLNPEVHAIFRPYRRNAIHTDFYAFRPKLYDELKVPTAVLLEWMNQPYLSAERFLFEMFGSLLTEYQWCTATSLRSTHCIEGSETPNGNSTLPANRVAIVPNVTIPSMFARMIGVASPILHIHELVAYCPHYFNATDSIEF